MFGRNNRIIPPSELGVSADLFQLCGLLCGSLKKFSRLVPKMISSFKFPGESMMPAFF
jgi:hypothetical protein